MQGGPTLNSKRRVSLRPHDPISLKPILDKAKASPSSHCSGTSLTTCVDLPDVLYTQTTSQGAAGFRSTSPKNWGNVTVLMRLLPASPTRPRHLLGSLL